MTIHPHTHLKMTGCRRSSLKRNAVIFPCSPSVILSFCLVLVYLFSLAKGVSLGGGPGEVVQPLPQGEEEEVEGHAVIESSHPSAVTSTINNNSRVKRSRDYQQQLCGYRLLDALRTVCDRNFVGFTRRSDPSFNDGGDVQSGEDVFLASSNMNPWDVALLTLEYPRPSVGSSPSGGDILLAPSGPNRESNSLLDYFELLPQQPPVVPPSSFPWSSARGSNVGGGPQSSSKAIALKMLAEPPKTHQRFRRNIIDECCKKPCAMNQMLKYCAITAVGKRSY